MEVRPNPSSSPKLEQTSVQHWGGNGEVGRCTGCHTKQGVSKCFVFSLPHLRIYFLCVIKILATGPTPTSSDTLQSSPPATHPYFALTRTLLRRGLVEMRRHKSSVWRFGALLWRGLVEMRRVQIFREEVWCSLMARVGGDEEGANLL